MALGDERRESGRRMEQARRQSGKDMEAQRRALDAAMVARRRGEQVVDDFQRLESAPRTQRSLPAVPRIGGIPPSSGTAYYADKPKMGGGGGAGGPFTEVPDSRVYSEDETWVETIDGAGLLKVRVPKTLYFASDADPEALPIEVNLDAE